MSAATAADTIGAGVRRAAPLALAGLIANAANVVVTVVLARLLVTRGYGALNQLTGVFWVVSTPGTAVVVAVVRRVTAPGTARPAVARWAQRLHRYGIVAVLGVALVTLTVGPSLGRALGRSDPLGLEAAVVAGAVWVLLGLDRGLLQAGRAYRSLSQNLLVEGATRTTAMLALGAAFGVTGAAIGLLVAEMATAAHARVAAHRVWATSGEHWWHRRLAATTMAPDRRSLVDVGCAVAGLACLAVLQQADVIVMGAEGPASAGAYAAVSVSCKALVFAALVVAGFLVPEAAIRWREGSHALRQLGATGVLLGFPAMLLLIVAAAIPGPFLSTVFSHRYRTAAGAFLPLAGAMVLLAITVVVTLYLLGIGERRVVFVLVVAAGGLVGGVVACHGHPLATATVDLAVQAACAVLVVAELIGVHLRRPAAPIAGRNGRYAQQQ